MIRTHISDLINKVNTNIARRNDRLNNDSDKHKKIQNRIVSNQLAQICGLDHYLERSNNARQQYASKEVFDEFSHSVVKRGEVIQKYSNRKYG